MKVNRSQFVHHLARLACSGQITEVVFSDRFAASALTPDHLLLVVAPDLEGVEPLKEETGVADLALFMRALKLLPGEGNAGLEVEVYVDNNRLVIDDGVRGVQQLLIAAPKTIGTRIEEATVDKLFNTVPDDAPEIPLTRAILEGVAAAFSLYKAEEVELYVGPDGGKIVVGSEKTHRAEFPLEAGVSMQEYRLLFGRHLVDVFAVISDFSQAALHIGGPGKPVIITDGDYQYMLSPRAPSTDDRATTKKAEASDEAAEAPKHSRKRRKKAEASA